MAPAEVSLRALAHRARDSARASVAHPAHRCSLTTTRRRLRSCIPHRRFEQQYENRVQQLIASADPGEVRHGIKSSKY
jgi:hypothetical protein